MTSPRDELLHLVDQQIEDRLTDAGQKRLAELLSSDPELVAAYTQYICLHGQLFWDAGLSASPAIPATVESTSVASSPKLVSSKTNATSTFTRTTNLRSSRRLMALSAALVAVLAGWFAVSQSPNPQQSIVRTQPVQKPVPPTTDRNAIVAADNTPPLEMKPLELSPGRPWNTNPSPEPIVVADAADEERLPASFDDDTVVAEIDRILLTSWNEQNVAPSPVAGDFEWLRRVYLTMMGRVPTLAESETFLADKSLRKRLSLLNSVTTDSERASHFAVVWANLLIGRTNRPGVNRESLLEFLTAQFSSNQPWIDTVDQLITATGRNDQNGATNFLLAHLNNEATPATAVTARLFLGEQISCVQCHDHPFSKDVQQQDYWALNAFFKHTEKKTVPIANATNDRNMSSTPWMLVDRPDEDPMTYFETLKGIKKAVLPAYNGQAVPPKSDLNRRRELAKFLYADSDAKVARAMVNRMWDHFFGFGFTTPVDDMGPHATVSHPELLDLLTEAFVKSDYDLQRLTRWIAASRAWQSSSQAMAENVTDDPASGVAPLFSRVYVCLLYTSPSPRD